MRNISAFPQSERANGAIRKILAAHREELECSVFDLNRWGAADPGMSLRDYFAGQALAGIMANPERWKQIARDYKSGKKTYEQCSEANAVKAYSIADAMLTEREKEPPCQS